MPQIEDGKLKQPMTLNVYNRANELEQEIKRIEGMTGSNLDQAEGERIKQILPNFISLLRAHPQVIIKPTTNVGGELPLALDLVGMYRFFRLKIEEAMRLQPDRFLEESHRARQLFHKIADEQSINIDLVGVQQKSEVEITNEVVDGLNIIDIVTSSVYAQRLAAVSMDLGLERAPDYTTFVAGLDEAYLASTTQQ